MRAPQRRGPSKGCGLAVFGVFAVVVVCCWGADRYICHSWVAGHAESPDGRYLAVIEHTDCGATTAGFSRIRIADARVPEVLLAGPFWPAGLLLADAVFDSAGALWAVLEWTERRMLVIRCNSPSDAREWPYLPRLMEWRDVRIEYDPACPDLRGARPPPGGRLLSQ